MLKFAAFATALIAGTAAAARPSTSGHAADGGVGQLRRDAKPALTIKSGDTVVVHTLLTNSPTGLEKARRRARRCRAGVAATSSTGCRPTSAGPGGHILTGPIYIEGAEPGDTLEIRIHKIDLAIPYAYNGFRYGAGFLTDDFPYARIKIIPLDRQKMVAQFRARHRHAAASLLRQHGRGAAAGLRPLRLARRPPSSAATWTTRSWSPGRRSSCRCSCRARCSRSATAMPARAMARWTSPRWKPRWSAPSSSSCTRA